MKNFYRVAGPTYLFAFIAVLVPVLDWILGAWPMQFGEVAWRFSAVSLLSRATMFPLLGLLLAFGAALLLEHRRVLRVLSVLNGLLAFVLVVGVILFILDTLQVRVQVAADARTRFYMGSLMALAKFGFAFLLLLALSVNHWKAASVLSKTGRVGKAESAQTVVPPTSRPPVVSGGGA
jgi:hypothetical protein